MGIYTEQTWDYKYIEINIGTTILYHWQLLVACEQQSKRRLHELIWCTLQGFRGFMQTLAKVRHD